MTPLPVNPTVTVLVQSGKVVAVASNIDPELKVNIVTSQEAYGEAISNLPFDSANPNPQTQVLAAKH
jgi:hypothetical protein